METILNMKDSHGHNIESLLVKAISIAKDAHQYQVDKYGAPYIGHITRVMNAGNSVEEKMVGILHDIVEDTDWTFERLLEEGFSESIVDAVRCLTKTDENEDYEDFIERVTKNPLAIVVKINDLSDNLDIKRMPEVKTEDIKRLNKYLKAYRKLIEYK
jgi:(p)ppGpp synthase/HD superfamily hydrolase